MNEHKPKNFCLSNVRKDLIDQTFQNHLTILITYLRFLNPPPVGYYCDVVHELRRVSQAAFPKKYNLVRLAVPTAIYEVSFI